MLPDLIRPDELAKSLGVAQGTVYQWCRRGLIPFLDFGEPGKRGCIRFDPREIGEWLKKKHVPARKQPGGAPSAGQRS